MADLDTPANTLLTADAPPAEAEPIGAPATSADHRLAQAPAGGAIASPGPTSAVRAALSALAARPSRDPVTQQFIATSSARATTFQRSTAFWSAVEPAKRELVAHVQRDQALDVDAAQTLGGLIDAYAEVRLFRTSMFLRLVDQGGPITTKGKARALYRAYLEALDRETKLAQVLGLERKAKPVNPLDAVRAAVIEANK